MDDPRYVDRDLTNQHDGQENAEANKGEFLNQEQPAEEEQEDGRSDDGSNQATS